MQNHQLNDAVQQGQAALQSGRFQDAFEVFRQADQPETDDPRVLMGLAIAAKGLGDHQGSLNAIDRFIRVDHDQQPIALVMRGDALKGLGKQRQAIAAYMSAIQAVPPNAQLDARTISELKRAQQECSSAANIYESWLRNHVQTALGGDAVRHGSRGALTLDLIFGKQQVYQQQPQRFYFPELPPRQFYEASEFDWAEAVQAASDDIKAEFAVLSGDEHRFGAYVSADGREPHLRQHALTGSRDWSAIHLVRNGDRIEDNLASCPKTMTALGHAPVPEVQGQSPSILFSRLVPGAHIPPHTGLTNTRLICHLPIVLPDSCSIRVGNQTRGWTDGELLIFDDSIEHEARNASQCDRSVLIFDIWRPELTPDDRALVQSIFAGIAAFGEA
ncbi:MAG: aspartyl/asparaginyl beta-hydroxylase domain-containing protein [Pseudomonadota bacterium]